MSFLGINIFGIIYIIGLLIALIIGIYEFISYKGHKTTPQFEMIIPLALLSWITIGMYIYNLFTIKKLN